MYYFYLVKDGINKSFAHADRPSEASIAKAIEHGYRWIHETEAFELGIEIPNDSGHYGRITKPRAWPVPIKLNDGAIWAFWLNKWRALREYRGNNPSVKIMNQAEKTFRLNSGLPVNHDVIFIWNYASEMHDECCQSCHECDYADGCDSNGLF